MRTLLLVIAIAGCGQMYRKPGDTKSPPAEPTQAGDPQPTEPVWQQPGAQPPEPQSLPNEATQSGVDQRVGGQPDTHAEPSEAPVAPSTDNASPGRTTSNTITLTVNDGGPALGCASNSVTTAAGVVNNDAHVKIGESVVIFGIGGVGLNLVQFAHLVGANPIVAVDLIDGKLEMARSRGATHCLNSGKLGDVAGEIRRIVGPKGPDKVLETTGVKSVIELAYELTGADGACVLVGVPNEKVTIYTLPIHFNKVLTGSHGGDARPHIDIPRIISLIKAGRISFDGIITHEFPLDRINDALDLVRSGTAGRVLLRVNAP